MPDNEQPNPMMGGLPGSMISTGFSMIGGGLQQGGRISPQSAEALAQFGQGIAARLQDRWWKQEAENFKTTVLSKYTQQNQQLMQDYQAQLDEINKIDDPIQKSEAIQKVHIGVLGQLQQLDMNIFDSASEYATNPYVNMISEKLFTQRKEWFGALTQGQVDASQYASNTSAAQANMARTEHEKAQTGVVQQDADSRKMQARANLLQAQTIKDKVDEKDLSAIDKVFANIPNPDTIPEENRVAAIVSNGGSKLLEEQTKEEMREKEMSFALDYGDYNSSSGKMSNEEFQQKYYIDPDFLTDKDETKLVEIWRASAYPVARRNAANEIFEYHRLKQGGFQDTPPQPKPEPRPSLAEKRPSLLDEQVSISKDDQIAIDFLVNEKGWKEQKAIEFIQKNTGLENEGFWTKLLGRIGSDVSQAARAKESVELATRDIAKKVDKVLERKEKDDPELIEQQLISLAREFERRTGKKVKNINDLIVLPEDIKSKDAPEKSGRKKKLEDLINKAPRKGGRLLYSEEPK